MSAILPNPENMWPTEDYRRLEAEAYENKYPPVKRMQSWYRIHLHSVRACYRISDCGALVECHP